MALVRGCHVIGKGDIFRAKSIAPDILQKGLLVNNAFWGTAAWAFSINMVPEASRQSPMVVFDVEDRYVEEKELGKLKDGRRYFVLKLRGNLNLFDYVPIHVLGFVNLPSFQAYQGPIGFFVS